MTPDVTLVGMDLGTFRTSIVSSTGQRAELETVVGWPKDHVARSVIGQDVVFGSEAIEQRMALDVVRPFGNGIFKFNSHAEQGLDATQVEKHQEAARTLVDHAVSLVTPDQRDKIYGVVGVPSRATIVNKEYIIAATKTAFDAVILVPEPFTVAYSMNQLIDALVVDIGAGTIDVCPMFGTFPHDSDQLTIPFGGDAVDEDFYNAVMTANPDARFSMKLARQIKEKHGCLGNHDDKVVISLPVKGKPTDIDVTAELKEACSKILPPIIECVTELVARYEPDVQYSLLRNILLGGGGSQLRGLTDQLELALQPYGGGSVTRSYDSVFAGAAGALKIAMSTPDEYWTRMQQTHALSTV